MSERRSTGSRLLSLPSSTSRVRSAAISMRLSTASQAIALRSSLVPRASSCSWEAVRCCSRCRSSDSSRLPVLAERACRALRSSTAAFVRAQSPCSSRWMPAITAASSGRRPAAVKLRQ